MPCLSCKAKTIILYNNDHTHSHVKCVSQSGPLVAFSQTYCTISNSLLKTLFKSKKKIFIYGLLRHTGTFSPCNSGRKIQALNKQ